MIKKFIDSLFAKNKECKHVYNKNTHLWDFHSGSDGEIYIRIAEVCEECGYERVTATRLPDEVSTLLKASALPIWTMGSNRKK